MVIHSDHAGTACDPSNAILCSFMTEPADEWASAVFDAILD